MGYPRKNPGNVAPIVYAYLRDRPGRVFEAADLARRTGLDATSGSVPSALARMVSGGYGARGKDGQPVVNPYPHIERVAKGQYRYNPPDAPQEATVTALPTAQPQPSEDDATYRLVKVLHDDGTMAVVLDEDTGTVYRMAKLS